MAGIYQRDNLNLTAAIDNAIRNRMEFEQREAQRRNEMVKAGSNAAMALGRTWETSQQDDEGMPNRNSPEYRAARFDYIVNGDRSGIDAYSSAMQSAIQNKLNRESTEKLAALNKESAKEEDEIAWRKDMTNARSDLNDVRNKYNQGLATDKDVEDAVANYNFHAERGAKKGYSNAPATESVVAPKTEAVGLDNMAKKMRESVSEMVAKDSASVDDLKAARIKASYLQEQGADMSKELASIDDKISKLEGPIAMKAAAAALDAAIASKDPDRIEEAAKAYDAFAKIEGYEGKKSTDARSTASKISKNRKYQAAKSKYGPKVKGSTVRAAKSRGEKVVQYTDEAGNKYDYKFQFVNDKPQIFYGGKWHDVNN